MIFYVILTGRFSAGAGKTGETLVLKARFRRDWEHFGGVPVSKYNRVHGASKQCSVSRALWVASRFWRTSSHFGTARCQVWMSCGKVGGH